VRAAPTRGWRAGVRGEGDFDMAILSKHQRRQVSGYVTLASLRATWEPMDTGECRVKGCYAPADPDELPTLFPVCEVHARERDRRTTRALVRSLDFWWRSMGVVAEGSKLDRRIREADRNDARSAKRARRATA
jgi:hypothetical protein